MTVNKNVDLSLSHRTVNRRCDFVAERFFPFDLTKNLKSQLAWKYPELFRSLITSRDVFLPFASRVDAERVTTVRSHFRKRLKLRSFVHPIENLKKVTIQRLDT